MGVKRLTAGDERDATVEKQDPAVSKTSVHLSGRWRWADHHPLELESGVAFPVVPEHDAMTLLLAAETALSLLRTPCAILELVGPLTLGMRSVPAFRARHGVGKVVYLDPLFGSRLPLGADLLNRESLAETQKRDPVKETLHGEVVVLRKSKKS